MNARRRRPGFSGALDGFQEHGFAETSIEQVSDLVDVSTTTLFRYFRSKDEAVSHNGFTLVFLDVLRAQPDPLDPLEAIRSVRPSAGEPIAVEPGNMGAADSFMSSGNLGTGPVTGPTGTRSTSPWPTICSTNTCDIDGRVIELALSYQEHLAKHPVDTVDRVPRGRRRRLTVEYVMGDQRVQIA